MVISYQYRQKKKKRGKECVEENGGGTGQAEKKACGAVGGSYGPSTLTG